MLTVPNANERVTAYQNGILRRERQSFPKRHGATEKLALRNQMSSKRSQVGTGEEATPMTKSNGHSAMSPLPKLLTETQVSMIFNVSINTLRYWRHCGDGPNYIKMGKLVRYHEAELESYVQRKTCVSKARATAEERHVAH